MTCQDFDTRFDAYARGALREDAAFALEQHAAECTSCAARLDALHRIDARTFSPALPPDLRAVTLAVLHEQRSRGQRRRWLGGGLAAAAVLLVALTLSQRRGGSTDIVASTRDSVPPAASPTALAADRATTEFEAIDAAERELRSAMAAAPGDAQLRAFLASITAQREELRRRVEAAHT